MAKLPAHCLLVKTAVSGVCGTDLRVLHGKIESEFPIVLGHEAAGSIVEIVTDVKHISNGVRIRVV